MNKKIKSAFLALWVGVNVIVAAAMVFTAFAGLIDTPKMPFAGLAGMTFIGWWIMGVIVLAADIFVNKWLCTFPAVALLVCMKPFLTFCPLNISTPKVMPQDSARVFKVMAYNVLSFYDNQNPDSGKIYNRTMHEILASDADVVFLSEYDFKGNMRNFVPQAQIDSLNTIYPYCSRGIEANTLYSKTPIMHITLPTRLYSRGSHEVFRTVVDGRGIMIFGVHLVSFGLTDEDKEIYQDITDMDSDVDDFRGVRSSLIHKLYEGFINRSEQAKLVREYVEQLNGENIIVCGDFNDIPASRPIRILEEAGLKDVYSEVGFGPMITFNDHRMYFRIDHFLYKGEFKPISMTRGTAKSSDHYPVMATFMWD